MRFKLSKCDYGLNGCLRTFYIEQSILLMFLRDFSICFITLIVTAFIVTSVNYQGIFKLSFSLTVLGYQLEVKFFVLPLLSGAAVIAKYRNYIYSESFLLVPSVGISLKTVYAFGNVSTKFININNIIDIIMIEAVIKQSVICYLALLIKDQHKELLYPILTNFHPSTETLQEIMRKTQTLLLNSLDNNS